MTRESRFGQTLLAFTCAAVVLANSNAFAQSSTALPDISGFVPDVPQAQELTLAQAEAIALAENPQIIQAIHQTFSSRQNLAGQRAFLNPTLNYAQVNNTIGLTNGMGSSSNYSGYVTLETNGAEHYRTNQAKAQLTGSQASERQTREIVRQAVDDAYGALQVADSQLQNEKDVYALVAKLRDLTRQQFEIGSGTQTNAIRAQVALAQEEQNLIAAASQEAQARASLDVQLGRDPKTPVDVAAPLAYAPIPLSDTTTLTALALRRRPEIDAADGSEQAAEASVNLAKTEYLPNVIFGGILADGIKGVGVGWTVPIDLGSIHGAVGSARETVKAQRAAKDQAVLGIRQDVQNAAIAVAQAQRAVDAYQNGILPQTESLLTRVTKGYELGANTILDVIDAQQTYRSTRSSYFAALGSWNQAVDQLRRAIGGDLPPR